MAGRSAYLWKRFGKGLPGTGWETRTDRATVATGATGKGGPAFVRKRRGGWRGVARVTDPSPCGRDVHPVSPGSTL